MASKMSFNINMTTVNSRLADTPLLWRLAITSIIQRPAKDRGLSGNDSRYLGLSLLQNYGHFRGTKITRFDQGLRRGRGLSK